jgi:hypothetical protein
MLTPLSLTIETPFRLGFEQRRQAQCADLKGSRKEACERLHPVPFQDQPGSCAAAAARVKECQACGR